jgi:hypothetical protein
MRVEVDSEEEGRGDDYDAPGDQARDLDDDRARWRRRVFILCGGIVALGACAWLIPGVHQPSAHEVAATRASMAALAKQQALPTVAYGSPWHEPSKPAASPASPAASPASPAAPAPSAASHPSPAPAASGGAAGACAPADIVLSLVTSQPSYAKGARPTFSVYAVSTSAAPCTLPYGAGAVHVIVTQHGHVVWDSSACKPSAAKPVQFTRGVPQMLTMVWNPKAADPAGCAGSLPAGTQGTLDAVAMSNGQSSPVHAFKLGSLSAERGLQGLTHVFHLGNLHRGTRTGTGGRARGDDRLAEAHALCLGHPARHAGHVAHLAGQADLADHDDPLRQGQVSHGARDGEGYRQVD